MFVCEKCGTQIADSQAYCKKCRQKEILFALATFLVSILCAVILSVTTGNSIAKGNGLICTMYIVSFVFAVFAFGYFINVLLKLNKYRYDNESFFYYKKVFVYSLVISSIIMVPFVLFDFIMSGKPVFLYYGDYNAQQIAFYRHAVEMVRSGCLYWDWNTDLGSNFIGSYSYYMLGSPFFWIMCLFPSSWAPYLMAPVYILKYITAALIAYAYIKRFAKNQNYAVMGALMYAFCGFQIYNTFFNQFHEVVAFFPLLLIGMEELVQNNRRGLFAIAVAMNAMCNYFMFFGQVVFCIFYFLFRFSQRSFRITLKKFGLLVFEAVLGMLLSAIIFLPASLGIAGNTRIGSYLSKKNLLLYLKSGKLYWQRYGQIVSSFFFPPDIPSRVNFFNGHEERWASISGYLPLFGMTGVFALFGTKRKRGWLKVFIAFLMFATVFPFFNGMFFMFNNQYYARWMYMLVLMMAVGTVVMLDDESEKLDRKWKGGVIATLVIAVAFFVPLGLLWYKRPNESIYKLGWPPYPARFWIYTAITLLGLALVWYLFTKLRRTKAFEETCLLFLCGMTVVYSVVHITNGKEYCWPHEFMVDQVVEGEVELPRDEFYRIDFYRDSSVSTLDNLGIYWGYPSIECFHTVVPGSIMEFYPKIGFTRNVGSRLESKYYGFRAFSSVKYSFIESTKTHNDSTEKDFVKVDSQNGFDIYENQNFIPMGFAYTQFMTESQFEKVGSGNRHLLLCRYLVVPDDKADYYRGFMEEVKVNSEQYEFPSYATFIESVSERKEMAGYSFEYESKGFTSKIKLDKANTVFYSVPYDDGWTATVNGKKAEVLRTTYGFMSVEVPAGDSEIVFSYRAPGMYAGIAITFVGLIIFVIYMYFGRKWFGKADFGFFKQNYYEKDEQPRVLKTVPDTEAIEAELMQNLELDQSVETTDQETEAKSTELPKTDEDNLQDQEQE